MRPETNTRVHNSIGQNRNRKGKNAYRKEMIAEYMERTHPYELWRGDVKFGKQPKEMTGAERQRLNKEYEKKFFADKSENARLWVWQPVDYKPLPKGTTVNDYRLMRMVRKKRETPKAE